MPHFGSASFSPLQASVPSVSVPVNNMHSSIHVLPPPSAVPLQTMSSNITNAIGQPESLPVPMLPAQPGSGFVSLSPAFAGGGFSSSGVNPTPVFFSAANCHAAPVQKQHYLPFVQLILCHLISTITTQVMQTYGDWQLQLQSSRLLSVVMLETFFLM